MISQPLLAIRCITYNHEPYIRQCLEGFVMQKTNFPFIAIVHDDASTDGTAKIIQEYAEKYPDIIKPIYETENQYSKHDGSLARIMNEAVPKDVKYIAMCEGDDYWTGPNKLQMQVDFLENNPEYGMCYTQAKMYNQKKGKYLLRFASREYRSYEYTFVNGNPVTTLTTVYRNNLYSNYFEEIKPQDKEWLMGDLPIWLYFMKNSKVKYFKKITGVYRILENSASHFKDEKKAQAFINSKHSVKKFFAEKYNEKELLNEYKSTCIFFEAYTQNNRELMVEKGKCFKKEYLTFQKNVFYMCARFSFVYSVFKKILQIKNSFLN